MEHKDLLERQDDLAELEAALNGIEAGAGHIVLVSGEAGIGKTSLVECFAHLHLDGAKVLRGYCDPLLTPSALGPLHDIAWQLGGDLFQLVGKGAGTPAIFACLLDAFKTSSDPTILVIEDIHWADEATLDLIRFLARRLHTTRALVIVTYRDDEVQRHDQLRFLLGNLATESGIRRIALARLSPGAVATLAKGRVTDLEELYRQTNGNPFFVSEVITNPGSGVPATVRDAVLGRASQVGPEGRGVLDLASVIGARIECALLEELPDYLPTGLNECIGTGILRDDGTVLAFRHELARNAILEEIEPLRRRAMYRDVLAAAVRMGFEEQGKFARLAHYAEGASSAEEVMRYGIAAARAAISVGSHREAAAHYKSVLLFSEDRPVAERAECYSAFAQECAVIDQLAEAAEAYRQAVSLWSAAGDPLRHGEALAALAWPLVRNGENAAADDAVDAAISILEPHGTTIELAKAYRTKAHLCMLDRDRDRAVEIGNKAIELATELGDNSIFAASEMVVGAAMLVFDEADGARHLDRALQIAQAEGLDEIVALVRMNAGSAYGEQYRFAEAEAELLKGLSHTNEHDLDHSGHYLTAWLALTHLFQGRWEEAAALSTQLIAQPGVSTVSRIMALVALGRVRTRRGDPGAPELLEEALNLARGTGTLQRLAPVHAARAEMAWFAGDLDMVGAEARAVFELATRIRHSWHTGELLYWRMRAGEKISDNPWIARPYGLQIAGDWKAAAKAWRKRGCPYEQARALAEGDEAAKMEALELFDGLGARPAGALLRHRMRSAGIRRVPRGPRASTRQNPFGLTSREMTILAFLVRGCSNVQIAEALFISAKTVDHHVSAILGKLGVSSRGDAAEIAVRQKLVGQNGEVRATK